MNSTEKPEFIPEYDGNDMTGYILKQGLELQLGVAEYVCSITNVYNTAIIVTNYNIWRATPCYGIGFCVKRIIAI